MAIKQRYKDNRGYLYKMNQRQQNAVPTWAEEPIPFYYNKVTKRKSIKNPMSGVYQATTTEVLLTDTQLDFIEGDRVTNKKIPINDAKRQDFSLIESISSTPINAKGNRYRNIEYYSYELTVT